MTQWYLVMLAAMLLALLVYVLRGPTIWDRMQGLNLISSTLTLAIVLYAFGSGEAVVLDIAIAFGLLGFVGIQFIAVFVRKRGNI